MALGVTKVFNFDTEMWEEATPDQLRKFGVAPEPERPRRSSDQRPINDGSYTVKVPRRG